MSHPEVLLVAFHYPPEISGGVPRALILEDFLVQSGCRVRVLTPQWPEGGCRGGEIVRVPRRIRRPQKPTAASPAASAIQAGVSLCRSAGRWLLLPDVFVLWSIRAARRAMEMAARRPVDLVVTSSPPESTHWIGYTLKRRFGCAWLADFRDGWTFEPHRSEAALPLRRLAERRLERRVLETADWITAATRPIADDFGSRYPRRRRRVHFLPTGFEPVSFALPSPGRDVFRMVYTGRFGLSRKTCTASTFFEGLRRAIESSPRFAAQFRLTLVGSYDDKDRAIWRSPPLDACVEERGPIAYEQALRVSAGATMLLLVTMAGQRSVATRKLFDYLAVRRPVFALAKDNEAARILQETRAGLCIAPDDAEAVAAGLLRAYAMWLAGTLDSEVPCSGNDLYEADPHFSRVVGDVVLAEIAQNRTSVVRSPMDYAA